MSISALNSSVTSQVASHTAAAAATTRAADGDYKTKGAGHEVKDSDGDYKPVATSTPTSTPIAGGTLSALSMLKKGG